MDEEFFINASDLAAMLRDSGKALQQKSAVLAALEASAPVGQTVTVSLSDQSLFRMGIGKRVLKRELFYAPKGDIPLYSANVEAGKEHGYVERSNLIDFSHPSLLWSIDSDFNMTVRASGDVFATTDHCGRVEILHPDLDAAYCAAAITYGYGRLFGFDRVTRPSLTRMKKVTFRVPSLPNGEFDLVTQKALASEYMAILEAIEEAKISIDEIKDLKPRADLPANAVDLGEYEDIADIRLARQRVKEIRDDDGKLIQGKKLRERLARLAN